MGAARLPSPARAAWPSALSFVAGEGRGWGNIKLSFRLSHEEDRYIELFAQPR